MGNWLTSFFSRFLRKEGGIVRGERESFVCSPVALNEKGKLCFSRGDLQGALDCFDAALSIKSDYSDAVANRGVVLKDMGRFSDALNCFDAALSFNPENVSFLYNKGLTLLDLQRPVDALKCFDIVLAVSHRNADAHNARGVALSKLLRMDEALESLQSALEIRSDWVEVYCNQGQVLHDIHRFQDALESYNAAISLNGSNCDAYIKRGRLFWDMQRYDEALADFDAASNINPCLVEVHGFKGLVFRRLSKMEQAIASFDAAIVIEPDCADAYFNRGVTQLDLQRNDEALESLDMALSLKEDWAEAYYNRGVALHRLMRQSEALYCFDRALGIKPYFPDAHNSRGVVLNDLQRQEEALASYNAALSLMPEHAEALNNRGVVGSDLIGPSFALECFDAALAINPDYVDAIFNKSLIMLQMGNYRDGWRLYEWRWKKEGVKAQFGFRDPSWLGQENISGKTLLIYPEQGFGDYIQFCRYALILKEMGVRVVLEVPKALLSVISTLDKDFAVIEKGKGNVSFDFQCPVMSLPLALGDKGADLSFKVPYLFAGETLLGKWQKKIGNTEKPKIGLVWSGSITHKKDYARSISLASFARVLELPVEFHCLQKDIRPHDELVLSSLPRVYRHADELEDFSDTAALIAAMDLVISVDTSVAHLACAMGKPVWILLPYASDFRWMLERDDSPWYPTATLIRQVEMGDWSGVLLKVERELVAKYFG